MGEDKNRGDSNRKLEPDERFRGDQQSQLAEDLLAAGEDPTALGVGWRKEIGQKADKVCKKLVQEQQVGRSNGFEAVGGLPVSALAAAVEDELQLAHEQQAGRSNGFDRLEAASGLPVGALAAAHEDEEAVRESLGLHKVILNLRHY